MASEGGGEAEQAARREKEKAAKAEQHRLVADIASRVKGVS